MPRKIDPSAFAISGGNEFFYVDEHGKKQDAALHEAMLDNPAADDWSARQAIADAVGSEIDLNEALAAYATDNVLIKHGRSLRSQPAAKSRQNHLFGPTP